MKKTILSWDVGVINLAYCIMEVYQDQDQNENQCIIKEWDIINVINKDTIKCDGKKKNGDDCTNLAVLEGLNTNLSKNFYCRLHKNSYNPLEKDWREKCMEVCKEGLCEFVFPKKNLNCNKNVSFRIFDKVYCTTHKNKIINDYEKQFELKKIKKISAKNVNFNDLSIKLYNHLDNRASLMNVDEVLIENQPSFKNPNMKTISALLYGYFTLRGMIDHKRIKSVKFTSPSNKLKVNSSNISEILKMIDENDKIYSIIIDLTKKHLGLDFKTKDELIKKIVNDKFEKYFDNKKSINNYVNLIITYLMDKKDTMLKIKNNKIDLNIKLEKDNFIKLVNKIEKDDKIYDVIKALSIKYTKVLLNDQKKWCDHIDKYKKKDDLCDAFLQGFYKK